MPMVLIADATSMLEEAWEAIFKPFGGIDRLVPSGGTVYLMPNGVRFTPHMSTRLPVVAAVMAYLREHGRK